MLQTAPGVTSCPRRSARGARSSGTVLRILQGMAFALASCGTATAGPLDGKTYIIELSSSQYASG